MRKDDADTNTHFRSRDRVFCLNGEWYFQTREDDHGPYPTRAAAEADLVRYVDEMGYVSGVQQPPAGKDPTFTDLTLVDKDEPPPTTH